MELPKSQNIVQKYWPALLQKSMKDWKTNPKSYLCSQLRKSEVYIKNLPLHHQELLDGYCSNLKHIQECVNRNQVVLSKISQGFPILFENKPISTDCIHDYGHREVKVTSEEIAKVETILKQLFREWSQDGHYERETCFKPIINEILERFPPNKEVKVLVPGAGLGRLPYELAVLGYTCEGNEYSLYMLVTSHFLLNRTKNTNEYIIHPWVHHFSNNQSFNEQSNPIRFPDTSPGNNQGKNLNISMTAGDFAEIYKTENEWDCIATCFFIDCSQNVISIVETIKKILKPGGVWVNFGPLMYHFSVIEDVQTISPPYHELKNIITRIGFSFEKESVGIPLEYCQNPASMLKSQYESIFFVCQKPSDNMCQKTIRAYSHKRKSVI